MSGSTRSSGNTWCKPTNFLTRTGATSLENGIGASLQRLDVNQAGDRLDRTSDLRGVPFHRQFGDARLKAMIRIGQVYWSESMSRKDGSAVRSLVIGFAPRTSYSAKIICDQGGLG